VIVYIIIFNVSFTSLYAKYFELPLYLWNKLALPCLNVFIAEEHLPSKISVQKGFPGKRKNIFYSPP